MAARIVPFDPSWLPAVRRFVERTWKRPTSDAFYRWRYLESPLSEGLLAVQDDEILATLWSFRRPWRVGDRIVEFVEAFDWYALPEMRRAGLGVRALQAAMQGDTPCILVGGTEDTRSLLPRLKWRRVGEAGRYLLPLRTDRIVPTLAQRTRLPAFAVRPMGDVLVRTWFRPRHRPLPGARAMPTGSVGEEVQQLLAKPLPWGTVPLWPEAHLRWLLAGFPGLGHFVPLYFARDSELLGFALVRLYPTPTGCDAELIELLGREADVELHAWMIAEAARCAAGFGAGLVGINTACPTTEAALRRNRFLRVFELPIHVWSKSGLELPGPLHVHSNTNDNPLVPHVEQWW